MSEDTSLAERPYRTVGRYRVYSELASGGMATVHLGCLLGPAGFSKLVAIKCLHAAFAVEQEFVARFLDEARLASSIHHPNVVASLDVVVENGELLVVMEYVHGETLAALLRSSRRTGDAPPVAVVTRVLCDALEGLHAAHIACLAGRHLNIVHRDVSPQNIMVGADGNTRVLDLGIAQAAVRSRVTAPGIVRGKIAYMSPEQAQGHAVDARTDVFAAGVVLWEALTGRRLFFSADSREALALLLRSSIAAPSALVPSLPAELDRVVLKALDRDPQRRFQTAHDFAEALRHAAGEGSRREVAGWVGRVAKDALAQRLQLLQALEASALSTQAPARAAVSSYPPRGPSPLDRTPTRATSVTSILPGSHHRRPRRWGPWLAAAGGVASALAAVAHISSLPPPFATDAPDAGAAAASVQTTQVRAQLPQSRSTSPPPAVAPDSLPLAPSTPSAPTSTRRNRKVKRRVVAAPAPLPAPNIVLSAAPGPSDSCSPPYRIDPSGVRRIKPECL